MFRCDACKRTFAAQKPLDDHLLSAGHARRAQLLTSKAVHGKATHLLVTKPFLEGRTQRALMGGYSKQKWISFCEAVMALGLTVHLYEARATASKYVTVSDKGRAFKVRFSNHRPIKAREAAGDCDFFVGVCNSVTTNTGQALSATRQFFGLEVA